MSVTFYLSVRIYWRILDGAECNRQFIKMHFPEKDPVPAHFTTFNPHTGGEIVFIVDCKVSSKCFIHSQHKIPLS